MNVALVILVALIIIIVVVRLAYRRRRMTSRLNHPVSIPERLSQWIDKDV